MLVGGTGRSFARRALTKQLEVPTYGTAFPESHPPPKRKDTDEIPVMSMIENSGKKNDDLLSEIASPSSI